MIEKIYKIGIVKKWSFICNAKKELNKKRNKNGICAYAKNLPEVLEEIGCLSLADSNFKGKENKQKKKT